MILNFALSLFVAGGVVARLMKCDRAPPTEQKANTKPNGNRTPNELAGTKKRTVSELPKTLAFKGFLTVDYIETNVIPTIPTNTERTYTAKEIAAEHQVTDATVRNRWFSWISKVAPIELLKSGKSYTELAHALFGEFSQVDKAERLAWVADAKERYASEWSSAGVIDCEVMPDNVGGTLALLQMSNSNLQQTLALKLAELEQFTDQVSAAENNFSAAEIQSFQAAGLQRGLQRYQIETQAEIDTVNALRQRRMQGGQNNAG